MQIMGAVGRWRRRTRVRKLISKGNAARSAAQWEFAAKAYSAALHLDGTLEHIHVQHGHALKESGKRDEARGAYQQALAINPDNADTWLQLGHVLKLLGRPADAVAAYRNALIVSPDFAPARSELLSLGASGAIPDAARSRALDTAATGIFEAGKTLNQIAADAERLNDSFHDYNEYRQTFPAIQPITAQDSRQEPISVIVDGRSSLAADVRLTLESLIDQKAHSWSSIVLLDPGLIEHPLVSLSYIDERISFVVEPPALGSGETLYLLVRAGTLLSPYALAWFQFAFDRTSMAAAYCDHDFATRDWRNRIFYSNPSFQSWFDPYWFEGLTSPLPVVCVAGDYVHQIDLDRSYERIACEINRRGGLCIHIPRLLASVISTGEPQLEQKRQSIVPLADLGAEPESVGSDKPTITIVICTRDHPDLIKKSVVTLVDNARHPENLELVVVDNRSSDPQTESGLQWLVEHYNIQVLRFDEPFNWSRANNAAVSATTGQLVVLVNNDTEMLTEGWDNTLVNYLNADDVGIVGARLLYPDRTVQHAGMVFGMNDAPPIHEAVGAEECDTGPDGRWIRRRSTSAVTGAFMAMRRETYVAAGGLDELYLPIAYNDIDLCLKVRSQGKRILYAPDLLLIHYESKTRGHTVTRVQVTWDRAELRILYARWGENLFRDPYFNPHWSRKGTAFGKLRDVPISEIIDYIGDQASGPLKTSVT